MAGLSDLKDQLRERWQAVSERVQENALYNNIIEKYEAWPLIAQRALWISLIAGAFLFLFSIPYSFLDSASQHLADFEERRVLIRELLKSSRASREMTPVISGPSSSDLKNQITNVLKMANLIPEQIAAISDTDAPEMQSLTPKGISNSSLSVQLKKLNVRQIADLGFEFGKIHPAVKLVSLELTAARDIKNYFDATFKLTSFSFPFGTGHRGAVSHDEESDE